ncbi:hypothetical protein ALC60_10629 [Trachymyrmex zeteki]|uniref:Myb/SANT-like DNA-binding domain-containing protein n=1 Tax=Mycetomoellerius zeteki TaxID=64791 RepID=A0A151WRM1_9HYME|nr:hypothetical protein ALC60_10629 [Trachymyrmex zeteki]
MLIASLTNEGNVEINYQYQLHSDNIKQLNDKQPEDLLSMFTNVQEEIDWEKRCQELKQLLAKSKNNFSWSEKAVFLMLEEYKKRAERFRNPENKKKRLWQEISDEMTKYGYKVKADVIDRKFRNLKMRYLRIKNSDKKETSESGRMSWIYFDIMSEIIFDNRTVNSK